MASLAGAPVAARGRRALDATLNLVPFIDLLSCCIAFLLITAVWTTLARVDAEPTDRDAAAEEPATIPSPLWTLYVTRDGWTLRQPDGAVLPAARATLPALLRAHAPVGPVVVRAADDVPYAVVIDAVDAARGAGVRMVSLAGE